MPKMTHYYPGTHWDGKREERGEKEFKLGEREEKTGLGTSQCAHKSTCAHAAAYPPHARSSRTPSWLKKNCSPGRGVKFRVPGVKEIQLMDMVNAEGV